MLGVEPTLPVIGRRSAVTTRQVDCPRPGQEPAGTICHAPCVHTRSSLHRVSLLARAAAHWGERLIEERGFACMVELLLKLRHCRPVVTEVPLTLRYDRKQGPSKIRIGRTVGQYLKLLVRDRLSPAPYRAL